uniref:DUF1985 domain-containing protein n=1 Tax=Cannabis sativa TaxID=3483 RepID=A0A803QPZ6_CANSA
MLHKMKVQVEKADKVWFYIGKNEAKFGVVEFALITKLNFIQGPSIEEKNAHMRNDRLLNLYFNKHGNVKMEHINAQFLNCEIAKDVYKLGQLMYSIQKHMMKMKGKLDKKELTEATGYIINGYTLTLQYWAYEAILEVGKKFAVSHGIQVPRMLSWSTYARTITYNDAEIVIVIGVEETHPEYDVYDPAIFKSQEKSHLTYQICYYCIFFRPRSCGVPRFGTEVRSKYTSLIALMEDVDVIFSDDYDPYVDENTSTLADATNISIAESKSHGEVLPLEGPPKGIQFLKRRKIPPTWFRNYTEMKKKLKSSTPFDPFIPPDDRLLESFRRWLCESIPNHRL